MLLILIMRDILLIIIQIVIVLFALSVHEAAHAFVALKVGDPTSKHRITLNPLVHIDPVGTVILPIILAITGAPVFGWAKPVMVNPYNFRNYKRDNMLVSAAGPGSNFLLGIVSIIIFKIMVALNLNSRIAFLIVMYLIYINFILAVFNLIPIPPLDGSGILEYFLKGEALYFYNTKIKPYGVWILLALIFLNVLDFIFNPIIKLINSILF